MVDNFFEFFPRTTYDINETGANQTVVDLTKRFVVKDSVINTASAFYTYLIQDGERPDHVANRFYGNPKLDWIVLMVNKIYDPFFEWPLGYYDFIEFMKGKYGTIETAHTQVHHYEKIVQTESYLGDGTRIPERVVIVDQTAYNSIPESDRRIVSNYRYEKDLNESRREIKILQERYLTKFVDEARTVLGVTN